MQDLPMFLELRLEFTSKKVVINGFDYLRGEQVK